MLKQIEKGERDREIKREMQEGEMRVKKWKGKYWYRWTGLKKGQREAKDWERERAYFLEKGKSEWKRNNVC